MIKRVLGFHFFMILLVLQEVHAYELATHGMVTEKAFGRSKLGADSVLFDQLGIDGTDLKVFGANYYDVAGNETRLRSQYDFEKGKMPNEGVDFLSVKGWLMRGAIREDDVLAGFSDHPPPQDDPYNTGDVIRDNRPLHHFYDPRNDRGLRVGLTIGEKAPDWGIGMEIPA